jgi:hypothetical protein
MRDERESLAQGFRTLDTDLKAILNSHNRTPDSELWVFDREME